MSQNPQELQNLILAMSNPAQRQQFVSQVPQQLQRLFTDRDYQFELIGQDGTQALSDYRNHILLGHPLSDQSKQIIGSLQSKLMALVESKPAVQ